MTPLAGDEIRQPWSQTRRVHRRPLYRPEISERELERMSSDSAWIYVGHESPGENPATSRHADRPPSRCLLVRARHGELQLLTHQCAIAAPWWWGECGHTSEFRCCITAGPITRRPAQDGAAAASAIPAFDPRNPELAMLRVAARRELPRLRSGASLRSAKLSATKHRGLSRVQDHSFRRNGRPRTRRRARGCGPAVFKHSYKGNGKLT